MTLLSFTSNVTISAFSENMQSMLVQSPMNVTTGAFPLTPHLLKAPVFPTAMFSEYTPAVDKGLLYLFPWEYSVRKEFMIWGIGIVTTFSLRVSLLQYEIIICSLNTAQKTRLKRCNPYRDT